MSLRANKRVYGCENNRNTSWINGIYKRCINVAAVKRASAFYFVCHETGAICQQKLYKGRIVSVNNGL